MMTAELSCNAGPTAGLADDLAKQGEFLGTWFLRVLRLETCRESTTLDIKSQSDEEDMP